MLSARSQKTILLFSVLLLFVSPILMLGASAATHSAQVKTIKVGNHPQYLAYNPSNKDLYVVNNNAGARGSVSIIGSSNKVIAKIIVGKNPFGIIYNPSNNEIYVANAGSNTVSVLKGNKVETTVTVGTSPYWLAYDPANQEIFVSNEGSNSVTAISSSNNAVAATISAENQPMGMAYNAANHAMYVAEYTTTQIISINNEITYTISKGMGGSNDPQAIAYNPADKEIFEVDYNSNAVYVISGITVTAILKDKGARTIAYDPANFDMYLTPNANGNNISVISTIKHSLRDYQYKIVASVPASLGDGMIYNPNNQNMYVVTYSSGDRVFLINKTNRLVGNIAVGLGATGIAYDASNNCVYVANFDANTVSAISS